MSSRLSKIRSVHTYYVMPRTGYLLILVESVCIMMAVAPSFSMILKLWQHLVAKSELFSVLGLSVNVIKCTIENGHLAHEMTFRLIIQSICFLAIKVNKSQIFIWELW